MAIIVGGHETGLRDTSLNVLNRNDRTHVNDPGHDDQVVINVSNGNVVVQHRDIFLPSRGEDFEMVRTYNVRGHSSDARPYEDARWTQSTFSRIIPRNEGGINYLEVENGDGSFFAFRLNASTGVYESVDGAGAYETLQVLPSRGNNEPAFLLTRANQTKLYFNGQGRLLQSVDTNGVVMSFFHDASGRLIQVQDDQGHVIYYQYDRGVLVRITDETQQVLVQYIYSQGRLTEVIDRMGHSTKYFYTNDNYLERIQLPSVAVDGAHGEQSTGVREIKFQYDSVNWRSSTRATAKVVRRITDAAGQVTTFDYSFQFSNPTPPVLPPPRGGFPTPGNGLSGNDRFYLGGSTRVVDALGNNRAYSNEQPYQDWRVANGFYARYDAATSNAAQVAAIRQKHMLQYAYNGGGNITEVIDQHGFRTTYQYDAKENVTAVVDRNGWGATQSDSAYFRQLRAQLGVTDASGNGKLVAALTDAEKAALLEAFTTHYEYDNRGNRTKTIDNEDNVTQFTYTAFNKLSSQTSAMGHALTVRDDPYYQQKRIELGYSATVTGLSDADKQALLNIYTTRYEYDAKQNIIRQIDEGGDVTSFEYDIYGNVTKRIVHLDAADLTNPAKQQTTQYFYDAFGNNIRTVDGEGHATSSAFDHFGNLTRFTDGNGNITLYTYDADNRLLTVTDPLGHATINAYDAVGNRIAVTDAKGHTVTRIFDLNNNLIATIDPALDSVAANARRSEFVYDVVGNRTLTRDANGRETRYVFDARRQLVETVTAEVADETGAARKRYSSTIAYDGEANAIRTTNNRGFATELLYTQNGLVRQQTEANGHITRTEYDANLNRITVIAGLQLPEAKRQILQFSYDEEDQLVKERDAQGNVVSYVYDAPGNRVAVIDANGHRSDFTYDRNNRLLRETRPQVIDPRSGAPVRYVVEHKFDAAGNEVETIDENGHVNRFYFDKDNRTVMVEDGNAIKTVFTYDANHNRTSVRLGATATWDATTRTVNIVDETDAQITTFEYDEFNQLVKSTDGVGNALAASNGALYQTLRSKLGKAADAAALSEQDRVDLRNLHSQRFSYDKVGNRLSAVDNLGRTTQFAYDELNRVMTQKEAVGTALERTTQFRYDGNNNLVETRDALGRSTKTVYDTMDRATDITDPLGVTTRNTYDAFGNVIDTTRAFGVPDARTTRFEYDLNNRVIKTIDPENHAQLIEYDAVGNRIKLVDGRGSATQYLYDALNRNVKIIDSLSFETLMEYDGAGNRISMIDARGGIQRIDYDAGNRQIRMTDAEGRISEFSYDVRGNQIEVRTGLHRSNPADVAQLEVTRYTYDAENKLRAVTDAEGKVTTTDYDRAYNIIEMVDGNGHATRSEFDALNRAIKVTDAQGGITTFAYDAVNNQLSQTDALGRVTAYEYDAGNRRIKQTAPDGVQTHFAYDAVGNQTRIIRAANVAGQEQSTTFVYNKDDKLIEQIDALGNQTRYEYDANHNQTRVTDPEGHVTTYHYDANNRVTEMVDALGGRTLYAYDGNGNRNQVTSPNGHVSTTYFNADNEVALAVDAEGFVTAFEYDNNGNVSKQTLHMTAVAGPLDPNVRPTVTAGAHDQAVRFEYDKLNRVTARIDAEGFRTEFQYDAVGNRLVQRQQIDGTRYAVTRSYFDKLNREIAAVTAEAYLTTRAYDAVGNVLSQTQYDTRVTIPADGTMPAPVAGDAGRTTLSAYDPNNRLVSQTSPSGVMTRFEYDSRGNQTAIVEAAGDAALERRTVLTYDALDRVVDSTDALGTVTHNEYDRDGNVTRRSEAYGNAGSLRETAFAYDANHRLIRQTDATGTVTEFTYDAAGNTVNRKTAVGIVGVERSETFTYDKNNRQIAAVNGEGERTEFAYDGAGNQTLVREFPGFGNEQREKRFEFDRDNRLVAEIDGRGTRTEHRYDGADNRIETKQAANVAGQERITTFEFDLDNRVTRTMDPEGGVTAIVYDVLGNATSTTDANGHTQTQQFDILGRLLSVQTAEGVRTTHTYDALGNRLSTTTAMPDGSDARLTAYAYDILGRQIEITDGEGFSTTFEYDVFGNQTKVTKGLYRVPPQLGDGSANPAYDAAKAARAVTQVNTFTYDKADRLRVSTDALGVTTDRSYDAVGNLVQQIVAANAPAPQITRFNYDLADRMVSARTAEGGVTRVTYDDVGNKIKEEILQSGADLDTGVKIERRFEYDDNGRLIVEIDGEGSRTEHEYDAVGNEITTRLAAGTADERVLRREYDRDNREVAALDGEGGRTEYRYDSAGNRIRVTDANGHVKRIYFDADNRMVAELDAENGLRTFTRDALGNVLTETVYMTAVAGAVDDFVVPTLSAGPLDRHTVFVYDRNGRVLQSTVGSGEVTRYSYDAVGNRTRMEDPLGRVTQYTYDGENRVITETAPDGVETTFSYDAAGNQLSETRAANRPESVTTHFEYDRENRLTKRIDADGAVTAFAYDRVGNQIATTDPLNHTVREEYDRNNRAVRHTDALNQTTTTLYDAVGNAVQTTDSRGNKTTFYYDDANRVTMSVDAQGYATESSYDAAGNLLTQTRRMTAVGVVDPATRPAPVADTAADQTVTSSYDALNRVIERTDGEGYKTQIDYDAVGNQLRVRQFLTLDGSVTATTHHYYDTLNREIATVSAQGYLVQQSYDARGNLLSRTVFDQPVTVPADGSVPLPQAGDEGRETRFDYDNRDRVIRETSPSGLVTAYAYDARGNKLSQTEGAGTATPRVTHFSYDAKDRLVDQTDALGVVTHRVYDLDGNEIERHEAFGTPEVRVTTFAYNANHQLIRETNALGVVTELVYDAAGNLIQRHLAVGTADARTESFAYDKNNRAISETNGAGDTKVYEYDGAGNQTKVILAPGQAEQRTTQMAYDRDNRLVSVVDGEGVRTEYRYDGADNKVESIQAAGVTGQERHTFYVHDADKRIVRITDPEGAVTRFEYDVLGNQTKIIDANGGIQENTFDILGRNLTTRSAGGILTRNEYNVFGNLVQTVQSNGDGSDARVLRYGYDAVNRQIRVDSADGYTTTLQYDAFGNQTQVTIAQYLIPTTDPGYDAAKAALAFPQTTHFSYDRDNRMLSMTDGVGNITTYEYDAVGNRTAQTEASNSAPRTTRMGYDKANRLVETRYPEGGIVRHTYDQTGSKITESILQRGDEATGTWIQKQFAYDGNGRLTAEIDSYGVRTEHEYDAMGNETAVRTAAGTPDERVVRKEYDLNNRETAQIDGEGHRTEFSYDAMGNRVKVTDPLGRIARYYYDASNNNIAVLDPEKYLNTFRYDAAGNRIEERVYTTRYTGPVSDTTAPDATTIAAPEDRITTFTYDRVNRVQTQTQADGSRTEFQYDGAGNLKREVQFANTANPRVLQYGHDLNNRVVKFTDVNGAVTDFAYDGANNKIRETLTGANDPITSRVTVYEYDLNNRLARQVFEPDGLNIIQTIAYDKAGNAVRKTDGNGYATVTEYDLNNRVIKQTDGSGHSTQFQFDAAGNQITLTDARGSVTRFEYDDNNRVVKEIAPEVTVYDGSTNTTRTLNPTVTHRYDAFGNRIETIDARGAKTTTYYDANNRKTKELDAGNVLREYTYNAYGEVVTETVYMTALTAAAHDTNVIPAAPAGASRTTSYTRDSAGRVVKITHPQADITTLTGTDTNSPSATTVTVQPEEHFRFDAFGKEIEHIDRAGRRIVTYYDVKDRIVAQVDPAGYLTEFTYDNQDHALEQRVYAAALNPSDVVVGTRPAAPSGAVHITNRAYDAAGRVLEELSPNVAVLDAATQAATNERIKTRFTYDAVGNETSKTIAADSAEAVTEYSYYDGANRRIALINGNRTVHVFGFDENGNETLRKRYMNTVDAGVNLAALDPRSTDFTALVAANAQDQTTAFAYDAANRMTAKTDQMAAGVTDDIVEAYSYDAGTNRTRSQIYTGTDTSQAVTTRSVYDALGRTVKTIAPDGTGTVIEYDAVGNQTSLYTGIVENRTVPATNLAVAFDGEFTVSWNGGDAVRSYVVYDTASRATAPETYQFRTGSRALGDTRVQLDTGALNVGQTVYFRVVTEDYAGNQAWTEERSMTIPPRVSNVEVRQTGAQSYTVTATFDGGAGAPKLLRDGAAEVPMTQVTGNVYQATLNNVTQPQDVIYRFSWQDTQGHTYTSAEVPFEAQGGHSGATATLSQRTLTGSTNAFKIDVDLRLDNAAASGFTLVTAEYRRDGGETGFTAVGLPGVDSGQGYRQYAFELGDTAGLAEGTYEVVLRATTVDGESRVLAGERIALSAAGSTPVSVQTLSVAAAPVGTDQIVVVDGHRVVSKRGDDGRVLADAGLSAAATVKYDVLYSDRQTNSHTIDLTSSAVTEPVFDNSNPPVQTGVTIVGYDTRIAVQLTAAEAAEVAGNVTLEYRPATGNTPFSTLAMTAGGTTYTAAPPRFAAPAASYEYRISYLNTAGRQVIVNWFTASTATAATQLTDRSHIIVAEELSGDVELTAGNVLRVDPGLYLGRLNDEFINASFTVNHTATGQAAGALSRDGREIGYFTHNTYNALDALVATNSETGLWREFGVDANGNRLVTTTYGAAGSTSLAEAKAANTAPEVRYTTFDGRNRKTAEFDVARPVEGETGTRRAVTRFDYDNSDQVVRETRPDGTFITRTYSALGRIESETDALGKTRRYNNDRRGNQVAATDALGHTRRMVYDPAGRLIQEIDGEGKITAHAYDAFDRRITTTNPLDKAQHAVYDQRDRLVKATGAEGDVTEFGYDARDNRTHIVSPNALALTTSDDPVYLRMRRHLGYVALDSAGSQLLDSNGQTFGKNAADLTDAEKQEIRTRFTTVQTFDTLNRVTGTVTYQNNQVVHEKRGYDAYGNVISETDGEGRARVHVYGGFGRQLEESDEGGRRTIYEHDVQGRVIREYSPDSGKDIRREYDAAGRVILINDVATGVSTRYTYDIMNLRKTERVDSGVHVARYPDSSTEINTGDHDRNVSYQYDAAGQMTRWADSVTGLHMNYLYEAGYLKRAHTDAGYDPDAKGVSTHTDHVYSYDKNDRVTSITQRGERFKEFDYDEAGNRNSAFISSAAEGQTAAQSFTYEYDDNGRVVKANLVNGTDDSEYATWKYDAQGNVAEFRSRKDDGMATTVYQYFENNRLHINTVDGQETENQMDRSGRTNRTIIRDLDNNKTFYNDHTYSADGRELRVVAHGNASGSSTSTYDANDKLVRLDQSQGDGQIRKEFATFVYNNDGQILYKFHDDGKLEARQRTDDNGQLISGAERHPRLESNYFYANGHPVGEVSETVKEVLTVTVATDSEGNEIRTETWNAQRSGRATLLDDGNYSLVQKIGEGVPAPSVTSYTVRQGDSLQSVAAAVYGNPSLWFVLAEANGLNAGDALREGTVLQIPNTVQSGGMTAEAHALYRESDIVGSTLPNLKSPPPKKKGCQSFLMIIITVVIAVVAVYLTAGLASAFLGGATAAAGTGVAATLTTIAAYAAAGAIVAAAASIVQQGLFMALGYQEEFSWKQVGQAAIVGAIGGAAQGAGQVAQAAAKLGEAAATTATYAKIAARALKVLEAATKQYLQNGKITSWTSLATAAIAPVHGAEGQNAVQGIDGDTFQTIANYASPWVQLAETAIRNDGELSPLDWANAVSGTLDQAMSETVGSGEEAKFKFFNDIPSEARGLVTHFAVGGAMSVFEPEYVQSYLESSIGNDFGQLIGGQIVAGLKSMGSGKPQGDAPKPVEDARKAQRLAAGSSDERDEQVPSGASQALAVNGEGQAVGDDGNMLPRSPSRELITVNGQVRDAATGEPVDTGLQFASVDDMFATDAVIMDEATGQPTQIGKHEVRKGDSFARIARQQLGPDASAADVVKYTQQLMELNPGLAQNPRGLPLGAELVLAAPGANVPVSAKTAALFNADVQVTVQRERTAGARALVDAINRGEGIPQIDRAFLSAFDSAQQREIVGALGNAMVSAMETGQRSSGLNEVNFEVLDEGTMGRVIMAGVERNERRAAGRLALKSADSKSSPFALTGDPMRDARVMEQRRMMTHGGASVSPSTRSDGPTLKEQGASFALDVTPIVGSLKSFVQLFTGKDLVTGETVNRWEEAAGMLLGIAPGGKLITKADEGVDLGKAVLRRTEGAGQATVKVADDVADNINSVRQNGLDKIPLRRTEGLGPTSTTKELLETGAIPGTQGVILNQRTVVFDDIWQMSERAGVEFILTKENGAFILRSGSLTRAPIQTGQRPIVHTHPTDEFGVNSLTPSLADIDILNAVWARNPSGPRPVSQILVGTERPTIFRATGFEPTPKKNPLKR